MPDNVKTVREALGLLSLMIMCGEEHTESSFEKRLLAEHALNSLMDRDKFIEKLEGMKVDNKATGDLYTKMWHRGRDVGIDAAIKTVKEM